MSVKESTHAWVWAYICIKWVFVWICVRIPLASWWLMAVYRAVSLDSRLELFLSLPLPQFARHDIGPALTLNHLHANWNAMSCGLGQHFIINSPSFTLSVVPFLPPRMHLLWFNLSGGKGRVSVEMNMNVVIMCDWECTADGCQDNMGASHPSRLVDEQEKSAELQWCMGCAGRAVRTNPPPVCSHRRCFFCSFLQSHAHLQRGLFVLRESCGHSQPHRTISTLFSPQTLDFWK